MSYCPVPIIFTGDFNYGDFEKDLESFNSVFTERNNKGNIEISVGDVDFNEPIDEKNCFYIKQDENFVNNVVEALELAAAFHNTKGENTDYDTFNIAIVGAKRAGKSTLTTRLLNKFCGKTGNDKCSVSNKIGKFYHEAGKDIPIAIIDVPGFEIGKDYDKQFIKWIGENEKDNRTKVHAIVYLINANNLPKPNNFGAPLKDLTTGKVLTNGEFFLPQEVEVFKFLKEKQIPVIFCIARAESVENGYKYLRKYFGDLTLISELNNYMSDEKNWSAEEQWLCSKWTRGTILQLKADGVNGLFGLVRLLTCIQDLYEKNDEYKQRLPESFKNNDNLKNLFTELKEKILKKEWKGKKFANDDVIGPLRSNNNKDMILEIFEKPLIESLKQLHENKSYIKGWVTFAKEILNFVCQYDYSADNETIAKEVTKKMKDKHCLVNLVSGVANTFSKLFSLFTDNKDDLSDCIENIIKMSLPNKKFLKDL
jgi:GTPase Era involved in 16S rRNA processing